MKSIKYSQNPGSSVAAKPKRGQGRPAASDTSGEELREVIIAAAAENYAKHGYHGSTVERILTTAGVSRPTFYRYFKNRREVLGIVIGQLNDSLRETLRALSLKKTSLQDAITVCIDAYFAWGKRIGPLAAPLYREINDLESPASEHRMRVVTEIVEQFQLLGKATGRPPLDPLLYEGLLYVVEHIGHNAFWPKEKSKKEIARYHAVITRILTASLALPGEYEALLPLEQLQPG